MNTLASKTFFAQEIWGNLWYLLFVKDNNRE